MGALGCRAQPGELPEHPPLLGQELEQLGWQRALRPSFWPCQEAWAAREAEVMKTVPAPKAVRLAHVSQGLALDS